MFKRNKLIDKKIKKLSEGKCYFCGINEYCLLDCHRIIPGEDGGRYVDSNVVVACSNCHRKVHDGKIKIDRYYSTTSGSNVLHYWEDGVEKWL